MPKKRAQSEAQQAALAAATTKAKDAAAARRADTELARLAEFGGAGPAREALEADAQHLQSTQALDILGFWEGVKC